MDDNLDQSPSAATSSVKLHVYRTEMGDNGTENCDYRGSGEAGAGPNDQHRTVAEADPANNDMVGYVEEHGPALNRIFAGLAEQQPDFAQVVATALGLEGTGPVGLRIGLWDH